MTDKLGGRKFTLALLSLASATGLVWFGKISPDAYSTVMMAVAGAYSLANVAQKVMTK